MEFLFVANVYTKWKEQNWKLNWNFYSALNVVLFSADEVWSGKKSPIIAPTFQKIYRNMYQNNLRKQKKRVEKGANHRDLL